MHPDYRHLPFLTAACFATILSGCSGGSSTDMSGGDMIPSGVTAESVGFIAGVDRIYASERTEGIADDAMTKVVEDTAQTPSGWNLTVDGKSVTYAGSDYGSRASAPHRYFNRFGDEEAWFWSEERDGFDGDRSEFDYLNVYGFVHSDIVSGADLSTVEPTDFERENFIYIVHGTLTADVPVSGAATYEGRVVAREWSSDSATFTSGSTVLDGRFDIIATFGASETEITGAFSFPNVPGATIPFAPAFRPHLASPLRRCSRAPALSRCTSRYCDTSNRTGTRSRGPLGNDRGGNASFRGVGDRSLQGWRGAVNFAGDWLDDECDRTWSGT